MCVYAHGELGIPRRKKDHFVYDNFAYAGGEIFFLTNLIMYNGRHETNVMASTFHKNSNDQIKSQSEK